MTYSREAHELVEATLQELIRKKGSQTAYPMMVGYLMVNVSLTDAQRIAKLVSEMKGGK